MRKGNKLIFFLINTIIGLYLVNYTVQFMKISEVISKFDPWIISIGGVLIIIGGINYFRVQSKRLDV
ncbi:MAG TPA: hypothetical protein ENG87_02465 [Candidatus Pacearchaeota archaeon]|nr:hypothetical protein BMS3Abin17_00485 [archaeon BMS3Abin17]HDK42218.1 hypothetical protein [Candidatus Pacearchaeota archaeon]HDZ61076.1 hypothetical protein [Candidatus Pacearchaeota archaeon]